MAAKTSWHRYGTKLRHCHPMYIARLQDKRHTIDTFLPACTWWDRAGTTSGTQSTRSYLRAHGEAKQVLRQVHNRHVLTWVHMVRPSRYYVRYTVDTFLPACTWWGRAGTSLHRCTARRRTSWFSDVETSQQSPSSPSQCSQTEAQPTQLNVTLCLFHVSFLGSGEFPTAQQLLTIPFKRLFTDTSEHIRFFLSALPVLHC